MRHAPKSVSASNDSFLFVSLTCFASFAVSWHVGFCWWSVCSLATRKRRLSSRLCNLLFGRFRQIPDREVGPDSVATSCNKSTSHRCKLCTVCKSSHAVSHSTGWATLSTAFAMSYVHQFRTFCFWSLSFKETHNLDVDQDMKRLHQNTNGVLIFRQLSVWSDTKTFCKGQPSPNVHLLTRANLNNDVHYCQSEW